MRPWKMVLQARQDSRNLQSKSVRLKQLSAPTIMGSNDGSCSPVTPGEPQVAQMEEPKPGAPVV